MTCRGSLRMHLEDLLDLYKREMTSPWYDPSTEVNEIALSILKFRLELLKDDQVRCGTQETGDIIEILENHPQLLFKAADSGEEFRPELRRIIARL
jgi:hypothetical protein